MMIMTQALMMVIFWNLLFFFFCTENTTFVVLLAIIVLVFAGIGKIIAAFLWPFLATRSGGSINCGQVLRQYRGLHSLKA